MRYRRIVDRVHSEGEDRAASWSPERLPPMLPVSRLEGEVGYGIAMFGGGFTGTPHLGFGLSEAGLASELGQTRRSRLRDRAGGDPARDRQRRHPGRA